MVLNSGEQNLKCISFKHNFQRSVKNFPRSSVQQAQRKNTVRLLITALLTSPLIQAIQQSPLF